MCQLVESLKLKDGRIQNPEYHQDRINRSMEELFPEAEKIRMTEVIQIPENCNSGVFKVRVIYRHLLERVEIEPYQFRRIQSLKVVHHESIDYHVKYTDRQILQELYSQRENCDDIIIVKNGFVTDSFAANLVFFDGKSWFTPTAPLLKGTKRQFLLDQKLISEREISIEDISGFQKIGLVNALVDFEEMPVLPVDRICF